MSSVKYISQAGIARSVKQSPSNAVASFVPHKLYSHYYRSGFNAQSGSFNDSINAVRKNLNDLVRNSFLIEHQSKPFLEVHKYMNKLEYLCIQVAEAGELDNDHLSELENQAEAILKELALLGEEIEEETREFRSVA